MTIVEQHCKHVRDLQEVIDTIENDNNALPEWLWKKIQALQTNPRSQTIFKGDTVRVVKDDPADTSLGIPEEKRWKVGEQFVVHSIEVKPYGTFLHDGCGHNLNIKRAEKVIKHGTDR